MDESEIAGMIRRIRRIADLSQRQLAEAASVSKSTIAAAEAGTGGLDARILARAARLASLRLTLVDQAGVEVAGMAGDTVRDRAGRRFPAHLDTGLSDDDWWHGPERYSRTQPTYTFIRARPRRDARRSRTGVPDDHLVPRPGDSPEERRRDRQDAVEEQRRAEWQRQRDAGELPPLPDWVCDCPPECPEDEAGAKASHADECACRCDLD